MKIRSFLAAAAILSAGILVGSATPAAENQIQAPFVADATGEPSTNAPLVEPWRVVALAPEYSGQ
jgi:hypothetical protein